MWHGNMVVYWLLLHSIVVRVWLEVAAPAGGRQEVLTTAKSVSLRTSGVCRKTLAGMYVWSM